MKITIFLGSLFLLASGCRRKLPDIDDQYIHINMIRNQRTTLPLIFRKNQPYVECTINGKKAVMLIDTGSTGVSLFRDRIERFGVKVVGMTTDKVHTAGGSMRFEKGDELTLTFTDTLSARIKYPTIFPNISFNADGIIGTGFLNELHSVINFSSKTITLGAESGAQNSSPKATDKNTP